MKPSLFQFLIKPGFWRNPLLAASVAGGVILWGCTRTANHPAPPPPITTQATQAPSPPEIKLGEPPKMPEEKK